MKASLLRIFTCIFSYLFLFNNTSASLAGDSTVVHVRRFDAKALEQYKTQADFKYETARPEGFDLPAWIEYLLAKWLAKIFSPHQQLNLLKLLFYGLMVFAALIIILNLMGIDMRSFFTGGSAPIITYGELEENVRKLDLDQLINEAYNNKQWRLAIRYQYLKALRLLTDKELINWQKGKTNMDYYYELKANNLKDVFLDVTGVFENAWYGHHYLNVTDYTRSSSEFERFYSQIKDYRS
jgi:hypothetical protein